MPFLAEIYLHITPQYQKMQNSKMWGGDVFYLFFKGEQGTAELGTNTVLKQTNYLCF